jgi:hypothetical protein
MARTNLTQLLPDKSVKAVEEVAVEAPAVAESPAAVTAPAAAAPVHLVTDEDVQVEMTAEPEPAANAANAGGAGGAAEATRAAGADDVAATGGVPHYLTFVRKETRLREDQIDALAIKARQINRNKTDTGLERITDNTLIRIAVDLLLEQKDKLWGNTEEELRNSVSS